MKQFLLGKWGKVAVVVLFLCIGVVLGTVFSGDPPNNDAVQLPTIGEMMKKSHKTVMERKNLNGTISSYEIASDPFFKGKYPFVTASLVTQSKYKTDNWKYRITYHYDTQKLEFCFADMWYTFAGEQYSLRGIPEVTASVGRVFSLYEEKFFTIQDTSQPVDSYLELWKGYELSQMGCYYFIYDAEKDYDLPVELNTGELTDGWLYYIYAPTGKIGAVSHESVIEYYTYADQVLYLTDNGVARTNYDASIKSKYLYQKNSWDKISHLQLCTVENSRMLIMLENDNRVLMHDIASNETTALMAAHKITKFAVSPNSTEIPDVVSNISKIDLGMTVYWEGVFTPEGDSGSYYYIPDQDIHYSTEDWKPVLPQPTSKGYLFVYDESSGASWQDADLSNCVKGSTYYYDYSTNRVYYFSDDQILSAETIDTHVYFSWKDEPNRIYSAPLSNFTDHILVYESDFDTINRFINAFSPFENPALAILEGNKRYCWLDLETGERVVFAEFYEIINAYVDDVNKDVQHWTDYNVIYFFGKPTEDSETDQYLYYRDTGVIEKTFRL